MLVISLIAVQSCNEDPETPAVAVGDFYEGGVVFYIDASGIHGLTSDILDLGFDKEWGCPTLLNFGAEGLEVGTGALNTLDIIAACSDITIAAALCSDLERNGKSDWFLPSKDELNLLYQNQTTINVTALANNGGSFVNGGRYWSSSHDNNNTVWIQYFVSGQQDGVMKDTEHYVRAIRAF